jgi:hypothetical protein
LRFKHKRRSCCIKGDRIIQLSFDHINSGIYTEYFKDDPVIGNVKGNKYRYIRALICHEFAHAVDFSSSYKTPRSVAFHSSKKLEKEQRRFHAKRWQNIYSILRKKFINVE